MKFSLVLYLFFFFNSHFYFFAKKAETVEQIQKPKQRTEIEYVVNFIKKHEGYVGTRYVCTAGYETIGYGHIIKKGETFEYLTMYQADSLLRADFAGAKRVILFHYPELKGNKLLAITHFVFCKGIGTLLRSGVYENGKLNEEKIMGMKYPQNRKFEVELFNR
jgi:GH24 family phage-related lysozyme (muramidase)